MDQSDESDVDLCVKNALRYMQQGYSLSDVAGFLGVHRTTIWRWLKLSNEWDGVYPKYSLEEVCWLIRNTVSIEQHGATWGIRFVQDHLKRLGFEVPRQRVRDALAMLMPELMNIRRHGCLQRRDYDVVEPMHVWHIDSHDKLARWGLRMHGAIDGATHYVVYMHVCLNKKASTIFQAYKGVVQRFGHPLLIRSDYAAEHNLIARNLERARPNTNAFRRGPSVHNQRIEAFWRIMREKVTGYYQQALHRLSFTEGLLEIDNPYDRCSLVAVFLPVIKAAVANFVATWNEHKVRAINERGRHRPAHVPSIFFQAREREAGLVLPPPYPEGAEFGFEEEAFRGNDFDSSLCNDSNRDEWNHNDDEGRFEEGILDLEDEDLWKIRDATFEANHNKVQLITMKFKLHRALTLECLHSERMGLPLDMHIRSMLIAPNLQMDRALTLTMLQHTINARSGGGGL